jgi:hypothetical protein
MKDVNVAYSQVPWKTRRALASWTPQISGLGIAAIADNEFISV